MHEGSPAFIDPSPFDQMRKWRLQKQRRTKRFFKAAFELCVLALSKAMVDGPGPHDADTCDAISKPTIKSSRQRL
jgi:hypothetical protein